MSHLDPGGAVLFCASIDLSASNAPSTLVDGCCGKLSSWKDLNPKHQRLPIRRRVISMKSVASTKKNAPFRNCEVPSAPQSSAVVCEQARRVQTRAGVSGWLRPGENTELCQSTEHPADGSSAQSGSDRSLRYAEGDAGAATCVIGPD